MAQKQAPHPRRKGSVVWATVLSWLSSLLLALLALCLVLMTTICSASYMKEQVNRSDFSEAAYSYLYDNFISYGASSGFSADVMTAALSRDQITADMADSITQRQRIGKEQRVKTPLLRLLCQSLVVGNIGQRSPRGTGVTPARLMVTTAVHKQVQM